MGSTVHTQAIEKIVNEKMRDPEWAHTLADYLNKMSTGFFPDWEVDVICQKWEMFPFSIYDAYAFAAIHSWISLGQIVMARVVVGETPHRDKFVEENNKILQNVGWGFEAEFWGGTQDEDGYFEIKSPILADVVDINNKRIIKKISGRFPLEVGYQSSAKSMIYLNGGYGGFARWPYGYDEIWIIKRIGQKSLYCPYNKRQIYQMRLI